MLVVYFIGLVLLLANGGHCDRTWDNVYNRLSLRLDDIVFDMKDLMSTVTATNQKLASFEKRLSEVADCSAKSEVAEERLANIDTHVKKVADVEVGRRTHLLRRGLEQEKAETMIRFESLRKNQEQLLLRAEDIERFQGAIVTRADDMDTRLNETRVQISNLEHEVFVTVFNTSKFFTMVETLENTQLAMKETSEKTTALLSVMEQEFKSTQRNVHTLQSQVQTLDETQVNLQSKTMVLEAKFDTKRADISRLTEDKIRTLIAVIEEEVKSTKRTFNTLQSQVQTLVGTQAELQSKTRATEVQVATTRADIIRLQRISDMCASNPCQNGATCNNLLIKYTCTCSGGWQGTNCDQDIDECAGNLCKNGATCNNLQNKYTCRCAGGWQGTNCEQDINECASNPCQNGATCNNILNKYTCTCSGGWQGTNCHQDINECASNPCQNGATCNNLLNKYMCTCSGGWKGTNCHQDINECAFVPCKNGATCRNLQNGYSCRCSPGWQGYNCDQDINECASNPCQNGATCNNLLNKYTCTCSGGWQGTNCHQGKDCSQLLSRGAALSGVYNITTPLTHTEMQVYCDMETDGGGWTIFQKRFNGSEDFYRNFKDYETGFGSVYAEYWLGLKYIQEITSSGSYQLRVDFKRWSGTKGYDVYGDFSLQPGTNYTMNIGSRLKSLGVASGYSLNGWPTISAAGCAFSTFDHDVDNSRSNCAITFRGGWWYNRCFDGINPNGQYAGSEPYEKGYMTYGLETAASITMMFKQA